MAEVIYVRGWDNPLDRVWQFAHPRDRRSNTILTLFDYVAGKRKKWIHWDGKQPPTTGPSSETNIGSPRSVLALYDYIKALTAGSLIELHFFTHGEPEGPVLINTYDNSGNPSARDPTDMDPRLKDFDIPTVLGGSEGARFKKAFSSKARVKLWGCSYTGAEGYRYMINRQYYRARDAATKNTIKTSYQLGIRNETYQFKLHEAIGIAVYAAPLGWGTNPYLPFGYNGKEVDKVKPKYRGKFPPSKGDQWWRVSQFFRPDRGHEFYTKVLGATIDELDYVAYTAKIAR